MLCGDQRLRDLGRSEAANRLADAVEDSIDGKLTLSLNVSGELSVHLNSTSESLDTLLDYGFKLLNNEDLTRIAYKRLDLVVIHRICTDSQHRRLKSHLLKRLLDVFCSHPSSDHA